LTSGKKRRQRSSGLCSDGSDVVFVVASSPLPISAISRRDCPVFYRGKIAFGNP
jgi:hypothetical protein